MSCTVDMSSINEFYCLKYDHPPESAGNSENGGPHHKEVVTFKKLQSSFNNHTTTHGIPNVAKSKGVFKKFLWIVLTFASAIGLGYNVYAITNTYLLYQVYVKTGMHHARQMTFPAVSVCNTNPLKKSAIHQSSRLQALISNWENSKRRRKRSTCPVAVEPVSGICFWAENTSDRRTYAETEAACTAAGGKVAVIDTADKKSHIFSTLPLSSTSIWINLGYSSTANQWLWDGSTPVSWTDWNSDPGTPPSDSAKICAYISSQTSSDRWTNVECNGVTAWGTLYGLYTVCQSGDSAAVETTTEATTTQAPTTTTQAPTTTTTTETPTTTTTTQAPTTTTTTQAPTTTTTTEATTTTTQAPTTTTTTEAPTTTTTTEAPTTTTTTEATTTTTQAPTTTTTTEAPTTTTTTEAPTTTTTTEAPTTPTTTTEATTTTTQAPTTTTTTEAPTTTTTEATTTTTQAPTTTTTTEAPTTTTTTEAPTTTTTFPLTSQETTTIAVLTTSMPSTTTPFSSVYPDRAPPREDFQRESDLMEVLSEIPEDEKKALGYFFPEFIIECKYNNKPCYQWNFGYFFDAVNGNCYVFNSGWNASEELYTTSRTGRNNGLELYINLGQNEYMESVAEAAGAVVVIHEQTRMPFPEDEGVYAPPGRVTSIGTRRVSVERLGDQYSNCTEREKSDFKINVYAEHYGVKYSINACEKTCYQKNVITTCGCADPQYPITGEAFGNVQVAACDVRDRTQDDCMYGISLKYINDQLGCNCPLPCTDALYSYSASRMSWPSEVETNTTLEKYKAQIASTLDSSTSQDYYRRNLLKVEVYLEELSFESMEELPKYPVMRYMSDLGAVIGLWLGCSLFSLLEFIEFGLDSAVLGYKKLKTKQLPKTVNVRPVSATAKVKPIIESDNSDSLRDINIKTTNSSDDVSVSSDETLLKSRRIATNNINRARRRGSIFDLFDKKAAENVYKVKKPECIALDEGYGSGNPSPPIFHNFNEKHGRWKPLHVAVHEKFLFGGKL